MLAYDDKRNFFRMMVNSACQVKLIEVQEAQAMSAICRDISATGMSIELNAKHVSEGTLIEITIDSQNDELRSLVAKSKVVRCDEISEQSCLVGVEITEMS
jgi:c-di-GMP-binding flagellar brake protein YcgR